MNWQPISQAPKDGTIIDVWIGGAFPGRHTNVFWGKPDHECGEMGEYCDSDWHAARPGWVDSTFQEFLHYVPTHWQPLPEPPEAH